MELLDSLPHMFKDTTRAESVYTAAVRGGLQALVSCIKHGVSAHANTLHRRTRADKFSFSKHVFLTMASIF